MRKTGLAAQRVSVTNVFKRSRQSQPPRTMMLVVLDRASLRMECEARRAERRARKRQPVRADFQREVTSNLSSTCLPRLFMTFATKSILPRLRYLISHSDFLLSSPSGSPDDGSLLQTPAWLLHVKGFCTRMGCESQSHRTPRLSV